MNKIKSVARLPVAFPLLVLFCASLIAVTLTLLRIRWTHDFHYLFLVWNLFLAWLPLLFALEVYQRHQRGERYGWRLGLLALLWLLFFPNAPYIFTDLVHLTERFRNQFWIDLSLVLLVAFTGFLVGFVSLYLMQSVVTERLGRAAGWGFITGVTWLSGFGIYLGRFLRWNSWDILVHPLGFSNSVGHLAVRQFASPGFGVGFPLLFGTFLFLGYLMLYALTHLQPEPGKAAVV